MSTDLTPKQAAVLAFMRDFFADNDQLPSAPTIRSRFGWSSPNSAVEHLLALARKGYIEHNAVGHYRFARPPSQEGTAC